MNVPPPLNECTPASTLPAGGEAGTVIPLTSRILEMVQYSGDPGSLSCFIDTLRNSEQAVSSPRIGHVTWMGELLQTFGI